MIFFHRKAASGTEIARWRIDLRGRVAQRGKRLTPVERKDQESARHHRGNGVVLWLSEPPSPASRPEMSAARARRWKWTDSQIMQHRTIQRFVRFSSNGHSIQNGTQ